MGKRNYMTLLKGDHALGKNMYVEGVIRGIEYATCKCKPEGDYATVVLANGDSIMTTECTKSEYRSFSKIVEELYPGLCIFDYAG